LQRRVGWGFAPARPITRGTDASGQALRGSVVRVVDRTRWRVRSQVDPYWTLTGRRVQRVRSNDVVSSVTTTSLSDAHCYCLSCSDRTRPVTLTGASSHHVFHCVVL
jgi:hypothetical protein